MIQESDSRPVRVCFVIDGLRRAGTELRLVRLINLFDRSRIEPVLCLLNASKSETAKLEPANCQVIHLGVQSLRKWKTIQSAIEFAKYLRNQKIDIVETYYRDSTYFAVPVARYAGVPYVLNTAFNLGYWLKPLDRIIHRLYRKMIHATVTNSKAAREAAMSNFGISQDRVAVLENGIPLNDYIELPLIDEDRFKSGAVRVGMVANLRPVKDPLVFVRAASILSQKFPRMRFYIAGDGELRKDVNELCQSSFMQDKFQIEGAVTDVAGFLSKIDVAVLCSRSEGLSNSLIEYMSAGRAIVATNVGGNQELINDGVHGLLVPSKSENALVEGVEKFMSAPDLAVACAHNARQRAVEHFSDESMVSRYENYYLNLVR